jgi:hypothetical protein
MVPPRWLEVKRLDFYSGPLDVVLALGRPRPLGPGLSGIQCITIQGSGYEFPRIHLLGNLVNRSTSLLVKNSCS